MPDRSPIRQTSSMESLFMTLVVRGTDERRE
jgi:hypothetical protein